MPTPTSTKNEIPSFRLPPQPPRACVFDTTGERDGCQASPTILMTLLRPTGTIYTRGFYCVPHAHAQCAKWMTENRELREKGLFRYIRSLVIEPATEYTERAAHLRRLIQAYEQEQQEGEHA